MVHTCVFIGFGSIAQSWLREIKSHPEWKLIGIIDVDTELLGNIETMPQLKDMDLQGDTSIDNFVALNQKPDLAIICTPIYTHHVLVKETMDHGINVICEKNMASSIYEGRQMVQLALDHPELGTAVGTNYRYQAHNWTAKKYMQNDPSIGKLAYIRWASAGNWGEKRTGWRRWIQDIYIEDMAVHHLDLMRYITGLDIVQVKADLFIPRYSQWQGSSSVFVNLGLAAPEDYNHRHNWVWAQYYGDWQMRGRGFNDVTFYGEKGQAKFSEWGLDLKIYKDTEGKEFEEDGFLMADAGPIEGYDDKHQSQGHILEEMHRCIESGGQEQPLTNFKEAFKSFAVSQGAIESSRYGKNIWVPNYWKDLPF
jgi:predicted dehydrogenase